MKASTARPLPVWRSMLSVPVNIDRFVDGAHRRGADCIMIDLEDSIPLHEKARARTLVENAVGKAGRGGADICVRVNGPIELAVPDLEYAVLPQVSVISVPKIDSASHLRILSDFVSRLEEKRGMEIGATRFFVMVDTADAYHRLHEIAHAVDRNAALMLGSEDLAADCEMLPTPETLLNYKQQMIVAAKSAGIMPLGYIDTITDLSNWDSFRRMVRRSREFGYMGAVCIHRQQVVIANEEFQPSPQEVEQATKIVALNSKAAASGSGAFELDGRMIDVPVVRRAERLLARHGLILARKQRVRSPA